MKHQLLLHLGTHKTGTTTLQSFLHSNADMLSSSGVFYPSPQRFGLPNADAHHQFAHNIAEEGEHLRAGIEFLSAVGNESISRNNALLLSAEAIYRHRLRGFDSFWAGHNAYLRRIKENADKFYINAIIYLRPVDDFAESVYHERVSQGEVNNFMDCVVKYDFLWDYDSHLSSLRVNFDHITIRSYSLAKNIGIVDDFLNCIGCANISSDGMIWKRPSPHPLATLWMRLRNSKSVSDLKMRRTFLRSDILDKMLSKHPYFTLWERSAHEAFCSKWKADISIEARETAVLDDAMVKNFDQLYGAFCADRRRT